MLKLTIALAIYVATLEIWMDLVVMHYIEKSDV